MELLTKFLNTPITQVAGFAFILIILQRAGIDVVGIIKALFGKNGNGKNGKNEIIELKNQLDAIESNHLHTLEEKLDKILELLIRIDTKLK